MPKKIEGYGQFRVQCATCKSRFTYEYSDTKSYMSDGLPQSKVECPVCKTELRHVVQNYLGVVPTT